MARKTLVISNTNLIFRNLSGKASDFNKEGSRNTGVIIPPEMVDDLVNDGWSVKQLPARDPQESPLYYMKLGLIIFRLRFICVRLIIKFRLMKSLLVRLITAKSHLLILRLHRMTIALL